MVYPGTMGPKRSGPVDPSSTVPHARGGTDAPSGDAITAHTVTPNPDPVELELQRELQLAFAPIHKKALGIAVGTACAVLMTAITLVHMLFDPQVNIRLLAHYFYGYSVGWLGLLVGGFWAFVVGFVGGWFGAFCRNLMIAVSVFITRTRAELRETRDFLDHI